MLVKKKNPDWQPSEKPDLKVGETIDMSDPKALILGGDAIGLAEDGVTELSAYELYGVMVEDELAGYQEYIKVKKMQQQKALLEQQNAELEKQVQAEVAPKDKEETKVEEKKEETKTEAPKEQSFAEKMAAARAAKKAEREAQNA